MNPLIREAVKITEDFGTATFVGAVAVMLHTSELRQSKDLDFVVAEQIPVEEFLDKGYRIEYSGGKSKKFTPRGYKIDVYDKRGLNDIPLKTIIDTAAIIPVDKQGTSVVKAISLEGLIVSKYRSGRDQDNEDLRRLAIRCLPKINWQEIKELVKNDLEFTSIKGAMNYLSTI